MAADKRAPKKVPRSIQEFQDIEDRLAKIQADFRDIRTGMRESGMESLELAIGTFLMYVDNMEGLAKKYKGSFEAQKAAMLAKQSRERILSERASKTKKH